RNSEGCSNPKLLQQFLISLVLIIHTCLHRDEIHSADRTGTQFILYYFRVHWAGKSLRHLLRGWCFNEIHPTHRAIPRFVICFFSLTVHRTVKGSRSSRSFFCTFFRRFFRFLSRHSDRISSSIILQFFLKGFK